MSSSDLGYKKRPWLRALLTRHGPRVSSFSLSAHGSPVGISFLDLSAHLAISINVHSIINKAELGFTNLACLCTQYKLSPIPQKEKVKGKHVTQTTLHLPFTRPLDSLSVPLTRMSVHFFSFLIVANSILEQRFTALCLLHYLTQILSCLPVSESSYTLLPE